MGAVVTEPQPMRNVDFDARQLSPDALWLAAAPDENLAYAVEKKNFLAAVQSKGVSEEQRRDIMASRGFGGGGGVSSSGGGDDGESAALHPSGHEHGQYDHGLLSQAGLTEYFASLTEGAPVEVRAMTGRGNGLVATRALTQGEVLWSEAPLVWCEITRAEQMHLRRSTVRERIGSAAPG